MAITQDDLREMVEEHRGEIGRRFSLHQFNRYSSPDAIRHFALGYGDDNPLWCDEDYGRSSPWRSVIAPPSFVLSCGLPRSRGLAGAHGFLAGARIEHQRPFRSGERIVAESALESLEEKHGKFAGTAYNQLYRTDFTCGDECVATMVSYSFRTLRDGSAKRGKYRELTRPTYVPEQIAELRRHYVRETEQRRGARPLDLEEVQVGLDLPTILKGPLSVSDIVTWLIGSGAVYARSSRQWYQFIDAHPAAGVDDDFGIPDTPERVHWDDALAQRIGMPGPYDYGAQRIAWLGHIVTDWLGDHGWVKSLDVRLVSPNYVGDLTTLSGRVVGLDPNCGEVTIDLTATDQRDRVTATGQAVAVLGVPPQ